MVVAIYVEKDDFADCRYNAVNVTLENYGEWRINFRVVADKGKCYTAILLNELLQDQSI